MIMIADVVVSIVPLIHHLVVEMTAVWALVMFVIVDVVVSIVPLIHYLVLMMMEMAVVFVMFVIADAVASIVPLTRRHYWVVVVEQQQEYMGGCLTNSLSTMRRLNLIDLLRMWPHPGYNPFPSFQRSLMIAYCRPCSRGEFSETKDRG